MPANKSNRIFWLCLAIWAGFNIWSFVAFAQTEAIGDSFTRGSNRIGQFLLYQLVAGMAAIFVWLTRTRLPESSTLRWLGRLPLALFLVLMASIAAFFIYGIFFV